MRRLMLVGAVLAAACSDALEQSSSAGQVIAVANARDNSVSFIAAADLSVRTVSLGTPSESATTAAGFGTTVIVPLGPADSVAVINNAGLCTGLCVRPVVVLPLARGSGATGVAISDDSTAWVANPKLSTATYLNYQRGDTLSFSVGTYPDAVVIDSPLVFVVNANLVSGTPAGPSSVTYRPAYLGAAPSTDFGTIPLSCVNARAATLGGDGFIYVVCAGHTGSADGRLSIVDPDGRTEVAVINGLGESPGAVTYHPSGRLLIASATEGILEVNTPTRSVTRGPGSGVKPGGDGVSGLAIDLRGRVYAVDPGTCAAAGVVHVLTAPPEYHEVGTATVGTCPTAAAVATVP